MRTSRGLSMCAVVTRSTWTSTMPPEFFTAWAMDSTSMVRASRSIVTLPSGSAVVPRRKATLIGKAGKRRCSRPRTVSTSTRSSVVIAFMRPPSRRGSMNVSMPTVVIRPGRPAAISRYSTEITPCGKQ